MSYRDETEALRAKIQELESALAEAERGWEKSAEKRVQDLRKKVDSQYETIREFNLTVSNLRSDLEDARAEARSAKRAAIFSTFLDRARIAFFFGFGLGIVGLAFWVLSSREEPVAGFVVSRRHRSPRTSTNCTGQGSSRNCSTTYYPEAWILHVSGDEEVFIREVSETEWERTALGSWYCLRPEAGCPPIPPLNEVVEE